MSRECPPPWSVAATSRIPLASRSKVTPILGIPARSGGIPVKTNVPKKLFSLTHHRFTLVNIDADARAVVNVSGEGLSVPARDGSVAFDDCRHSSGHCRDSQTHRHGFLHFKTLHCLVLDTNSQITLKHNKRMLERNQSRQDTQHQHFAKISLTRLTFKIIFLVLFQWMVFSIFYFEEIKRFFLEPKEH
jgi:hypothetical protein